MPLYSILVVQIQGGVNLKKLALLLAVIMAVAMPIGTMAENDAILAPIAEQIKALTVEQRAELMAGILLMMSFSGETDALNAATAKMSADMFGASEPTAQTTEAGTSDDVSVGMRLNPVPIGQMQEVAISVGGKGMANITVQEVWTCEEAATMIGEWPGWLVAPTNAQGFIALKVRVEITDTDADAAFHIHEAYFNLVSSDGVVYKDYATYINGYDRVPEMFKGGVAEGYMAFVVNNGDTPVLALDVSSDIIYFALN